MLQHTRVVKWSMLYTLEYARILPKSEYVYVYGAAKWCSGNSLDLRSIGRRFNFHRDKAA